MKKLFTSQKLLFIIFASNFVILLITSLIFLTFDRLTFKKQIVQDLEILAQIVGDNCQEALITENVKEAQKTLDTFLKKTDIISARIYDSSGHFFIDCNSGDATENEVILHPGDQVNKFANKEYHLSRQILRDGKIVGTIILKQNVQKMYSRTNRYFIIFIFICLIAFLLPVRSFDHYLIFMLIKYDQISTLKIITNEVVYGQTKFNVKKASIEDHGFSLCNSIEHTL